jgi:hypothetical protein
MPKPFPLKFQRDGHGHRRSNEARWRGGTPGAAARGRDPGSWCYREIATAMGYFPTLIALPAVLVAVRIGVTVPEPVLTT